MSRQCCVSNCESRRESVWLHKFPKTEIGLQKWVKCINSVHLTNLSQEDSQKIQKLHVCHKHFEFKMTSGKRLRLAAYPTLFTKEEMDTGVPSTDENSENHHLVDHGYYKPRKHEDHNYYKQCQNPLKEINIISDIGNDAPSTSGLNKNSKNNVQQATLCSTDVPTSDVTQGYDKENECGSMQGATDSAATSMPCLSTKHMGKQKRITVRRRLVNKLSDLSPRCHSMYKEYIMAKKQLNFVSRAKQAQKLSKEQFFEKLTAKMNPLAKKLFWLQIKLCTKDKTGRRFTEEEKLISLSILKQSPKTYKYLQRILILPSKGTLNKMIKNVKIESGINPQIFYVIKKEVEDWKEEKKYCTIIFDEVSLEPGVALDKSQDTICGFVELGEKRNKFADHALVFMIRGALCKWQQPIAFYFCEGATSALALKGLIKDITLNIIETGLIPVAFVCDQGTAFRSALNNIKEDTRREQILAGENIDDTLKIGQQYISVIYDPPHLIKGLRNNFLNKNILYEGKLCKWSDILDVYLTDCKHTEMRLLPKLHDEHVIPDKIKKMKVKNCTRVFSRTVASALAYTAQFSHYVDGKEVSGTLKNTSELIRFLDDLFDSCNGAVLVSTKGKLLRTAVKPSSQHEEFWKTAIEKLQKLKFIDNKGNKVSVPSQKNFITTLKSFMRLWDFFKLKGYRFMRPRYFNSDPIENFFGQVRAYNFRNNDPSCQTFKQIFRSLLITRFIHFHNENYNCEEVTGEQILKLKNLMHPASQDGGSQIPSSSCQIVMATTENIQVEARKERLAVHSRAYTVGWVIRKCFKKIKCKLCSGNMCQTVKSSTHSWISLKEYKEFKNTRKLTYPSENAVRYFSYIVKEANEYLETSPHVTQITNSIKHIIKTKYSFDFLTCTEHSSILLEYFLDIAIQLTVINWCNVINKILRGVDILRLRQMNLPLMQNTALEKYQKKLKNKKLNK